MPIAAVPCYLGTDFSTASPGMRFGMYLPLWGIDRRSKEVNWTTHDTKYEILGQNRQESAVRHENKVDALKAATELKTQDKSRMMALVTRQNTIAKSVPITNILSLDALATAPFTTGLGNEHPLENGFAFLSPYGLPYLPGSGIKGVLRQAARELASGDWGDDFGWNETAIHLLFGKESEDGDTEHQRGVLSLWDVIPRIKGDSLSVEIMTPHQGHYYQRDQTPHDSGSPIPINFLTVPPGSGFTFHVVCDVPRLTRLEPKFAHSDAWKTLLQAAFEHAFEWLGFGAKTSVGYGAMHENQTAKKQRADEAEKAQKDLAEQAEQERRASLSPEDQAHETNKKDIEAFRKLFEAAKAERYQPGSHFDTQRLDFMKKALAWNEARSRSNAAELLAQTMSKSWGTPGKKESKQKINQAIEGLKHSKAT
jgi:CRISPR-associated protein Cmr6